MPFQYQEVRLRFAIDFQGAAVIPLNGAFNLFAIHQHNHHWRVSVNLLLVIIDFCMSFSGRRLALSHLDGGRWPRTRLHTAATLHLSVNPLTLVDRIASRLYVSQRGSNKFAIHN